MHDRYHLRQQSRPLHNVHLANPCVIEAKWNELPSGEYAIYDRSAWVSEIEHSVLSKRAWVLQECLLSRRTIHFAADQISWECSRFRASESWPRGVPEDLECSVLKIEISLVDATKPLGPISAASIVLCGPICPVSFGPGIGTRVPRLQYADIGKFRFRRNFLTEHLDDSSTYHLPSETLAGMTTYFSRFTTKPFLHDGEQASVGLLLARSSESPAGVFKRIGYAKFFHSDTSSSFEQMCWPRFDLSSDAYVRKNDDDRFVFRII